MVEGLDSTLAGFHLKSCPRPRRRTLVKVGEEDNEGGKVTQAYYQVVLNKAYLA